MTTEAVIRNDPIPSTCAQQSLPVQTQLVLEEVSPQALNDLEAVKPIENQPDQQKAETAGDQALGVQNGESNKGEALLEPLKSSQELKIDFSENEKILASLSFNIDDLFKKISSLTEEVKSEIGVRTISSAGSVDKIESPRKKIQAVPKQAVTLQQMGSQSLPVAEEEAGISMRMFEVGQSLGYGKFGEVLECRHKSTGCLLALKKVFKSTIEEYRMQDQLLVELESMKRMRHPNVIASYTAFTDDFHIFIITEYALGVQLTKKFNSSEEVTSRIIGQVLNALQHMHEQGVVHRDLKPENIIVDELGTIKICDFGWAALAEKEPKMNILCGTLDYVCPEMVSGEEYTKEVDLWSVGILTYELIFGLSPFKAQDKSATFKKVKDLDYGMPGAYRFSEECVDFITKLLKPESERMRLSECLAHPFIVKYNKSSQADSQMWGNLFD